MQICNLADHTRFTIPGHGNRQYYKLPKGRFAPIAAPKAIREQSTLPKGIRTQVKPIA